MDTNRNTANNYQINTFTKGMNSDTSYDMIGADQYLFGLNIRITNNTLLGGSQNANRTEGVITPVPTCKEKAILSVNGSPILAKEILACTSLDDIGVVITLNVRYQQLHIYRPHTPKPKTTWYWTVYKVTQLDDCLEFEQWFTYDTNETGPISAVLHKETEDVVNLYIADGIHPIIQMNMVGDKPTGDIDYLISNRLMPTPRFMLEKTSGRLKTQQLLYTYRLYKKHGTTTRLAPLTNKFLVIDSNRNKELGNAEDTRTSIGFKLTLSFENDTRWTTNYDHLLVYRISYIKPNESPKIYLIYDDLVTTNIDVIDKGDDELQELSVDEFSALNSQIIIPKSIELNQGYLFAGDILDKTIIEFTDEEISEIRSKNKVYRTWTTISLEGDTTFSLITKFHNSSITIPGYFEQRGVKFDGNKLSYNDLFVSSLFRSLRRGEKYRYGVVYYNKYGARSNVFRIDRTYALTSEDLNVVFEEKELFEKNGNNLVAHPIGARFDIYIPNDTIVGYLIVRCLKTSEYTKNILLVALSRPMRLFMDNSDLSKLSPYYPNVLLTTQNCVISYTKSGNVVTGKEMIEHPQAEDMSFELNPNWAAYYALPAYNVKTTTLFLIFSPEINISRKDVLSDIQRDSVWFCSTNYLYGENPDVSVYKQKLFDIDGDDKLFHGLAYQIIKFNQDYQMENKSDNHKTVKYYNVLNQWRLGANIAIKQAADVKNPGWDQGFSNVQLGGSSSGLIQTAIKQYKSFQTNVDTHRYVNWVANGMYDLATTEDEANIQQSEMHYKYYIFDNTKDETYKDAGGYGWIGPGPVCLLATVDNDENNPLILYVPGNIGTYIANIQHTPLDYNDVYTPYYGFGNYFSNGVTNPVVFDGDIYITPAEFVNMFKTYDFNDKQYSLISGQMVYYIPLESRINTFFDYGMNYRNTSSTNLMLEPGEITGIASLARPLHLYNMIYSDNNTSIDIFMPYTKEDKDAINVIPHRICYSQLKIDGENIDSWLIFKPADFIDVDSKYGEITHLLTSDNTLYYWLNNAFGKLSVNERSLVKDENSNSILLGTGGVLNRYDYLSTRYGMSFADRAAIAAEHGVYWIDVLNNAIPAYTGQSVVNLAEVYNVQNIVNSLMNLDWKPVINYDLLNYELICLIEDKIQLIFNLKLLCATSIYTRLYSNCLDISNVLHCINIHPEQNYNLYSRKLNYINSKNSVEYLLSAFSFAVNTQASLTKVYDNLKLVFNHTINNLDNTIWKFTTDYNTIEQRPEIHSDRENNIWYPIPRKNSTTFNNGYGGRLRGKWLKTDIAINDPVEFALSHIITKFRQSYN